MILNGQHTQRIGENKSATDSFIWIAKKKEIQSIQISNKALTHSMDIWARERTQHTRYRWVDSQNKQMKLNREWNGRCAKRAKKMCVCVCVAMQKREKREYETQFIRNTFWLVNKMHERDRSIPMKTDKRKKETKCTVLYYWKDLNATAERKKKSFGRSK